MTKVSALPQLQQEDGQPEDYEAAAKAAGFSNQLVFLAVPLDFYQRLQQDAAARNMRLAELLSRAVEDYLRRTAPGTKEK